MAKPSFELVAELNAPGGGAWEGASQDITTGEWYMAHSLGSGEGKVHRFGASTKIAKPYKDTMVCRDLTHVYGFAAHDGELWLPWDASDGCDIVTLKHKAKTYSKSAARKLHVFTEHPAQVSMSVTRSRLVIMQTIGREQYRFTKRRTADVLANKDDALGKVITRPHDSKTDTWLQGFTLAGEFLYLLYGKGNEKAFIEKWSFETGKKAGTLDVTKAGFLPGEKPGNREPEGMDGHTFGVKVFEGADRRLRVYKLKGF